MSLLHFLKTVTESSLAIEIENYKVIDKLHFLKGSWK